MPDETRYAVSPEGEIVGFNPPVNAWDVVTHEEGWRYATTEEIKAHLNAAEAPEDVPAPEPVTTDQLLSEAAVTDLEAFTKDQLIDYAYARLGMTLDRRLSKNNLIEEIRRKAQDALGADEDEDSIGPDLP